MPGSPHLLICRSPWSLCQGCGSRNLAYVSFPTPQADSPGAGTWSKLGQSDHLSETAEPTDEGRGMWTGVGGDRKEELREEGSRGWTESRPSTSLCSQITCAFCCHRNFAHAPHPAMLFPLSSIGQKCQAPTCHLLKAAFLDHTTTTTTLPPMVNVSAPWCVHCWPPPQTPHLLG